jgi:ribosomal peptide maturation radical SAM protein 1
MNDAFAPPRGEHQEPIDICLIVPPFDALNFPALGSSLLAASCRKRGFRVKLIYGSMLLAARIGYKNYKAVCDTPTSLLLGEHLFLPHAYPPESLASVGKSVKLPAELQQIADKLASDIGPYQDDIASQVLALNPKIVGLSSTFQQNLAAAGLALRLRKAAPEILIVMGGANVAGPMGGGLAAAFPWIDHFFVGEADLEFVQFCEAYLHHGIRPPQTLVHCRPIGDMEQVSVPDFSDYFSLLRRLQNDGLMPDAFPDFLTMESSRGCWWGEKHHCTFCGLNGEGMGFRQKSPERVWDEITTLTTTWNAKRFFLADNIMPRSYFQTLLPKLAEWPERPRIFYEVKANLRDEHVETMVRAGIDTIQPGIESLSTNVLRLMQKGVSGLQNLSLLRICKSMGVRVAWNYLYGIPGESVEDYRSVLALLPKIEHLQPPSGMNKIIVDRFSPYHNTPEQFGIESLAPVAGYRGLYPSNTSLADIAYHFSGRYSTSLLEDNATIADLQLAIGVWKYQWREGISPPTLRIVDSKGTNLAIADTRRIAKQGLTVISRDVLGALVHLERPHVEDGLPRGVADHLDFLKDHNFVVEHEGHLLTIVSRPRVFANNLSPAGKVPENHQRLLP